MSEGQPPEGELTVPQLTSEELRAFANTDDEKADRESAKFAAGASEKDWEAEAKRNEHRRSEDFRDHFEGLAKTGLSIAFWTAVTFAGVWAWHVIAPSCLRWLDDDGLGHLQNLIAGGVLASLASEHFRRRLS